MAKRTPEDEKSRKEELEARKAKAIDLAVETFEALLFERGESGKIWASVLKEAIKRRKPGFNESYYGFRAFINLLEEAQARGLLEFGRDEKSNAYVFRSSSAAVSGETVAEQPAVALASASPEVGTIPAVLEEVAVKPEPRRKRGGRKPAAKKAEATEPQVVEAAPEVPPASEPPPQVAVEETTAKPPRKSASRPRRRKVDVSDDGA